MAIQHQVTHEGQLYYSVSLVAKLQGTTVAKVKTIANREGLEWQNFRDNGPIYISAASFSAYKKRLMDDR